MELFRVAFQLNRNTVSFGEAIVGGVPGGDRLVAVASDGRRDALFLAVERVVLEVGDETTAVRRLHDVTDVVVGGRRP